MRADLVESCVIFLVAFHPNAATCWKNWQPLKWWLFSCCLPLLPSKLLQTGGCLWHLLAPFVGLQRPCSPESTVKRQNCSPITEKKTKKNQKPPIPKTTRHYSWRGFKGKKRPVLSTQNLAEDKHEIELGVTRLWFAEDWLTLQLPFQRGSCPSSTCPLYPIPCSAAGAQKIPVSWFSALKPWRTNLIFLAAAATGWVFYQFNSLTPTPLSWEVTASATAREATAARSQGTGTLFLAANSPNQLQCQTTPSGLWWLERPKEWWRGQRRDRKSVKSKQTKDKENTHTRCKVGAGLWVLIVGTDGEIEREMTPITLKIICAREGGKGRNRERAVGEVGFWQTATGPVGKNGLRKIRIKTYCSKSQPSGFSVWLKNDPLKNSLIFSFNVWHLQGSPAPCTLHSHTKRVTRYNITIGFSQPSQHL